MQSKKHPSYIYRYLYMCVYKCVYINIIYSCSNTNQLFFALCCMLVYTVWSPFKHPPYTHTHTYTTSPIHLLLFIMKNLRKNGLKIKTWSQGKSFFLGLQTHTLSFPLLSTPPSHIIIFSHPSLCPYFTAGLLCCTDCKMYYFVLYWRQTNL